MSEQLVPTPPEPSMGSIRASRSASTLLTSAVANEAREPSSFGVESPPVDLTPVTLTSKVCAGILPSSWK